MRDKYTDAIRVGIISAINPENCTAEVTFSDRGGIVSRELPIIVPFTMKDKFYYMPAVEERVWVLFNPESPSKGCILGSYYADNRKPPYGDKYKAYALFEDETLIEYDKKQHKLTIRVPSKGERSVDIETESDIAVNTKGNIQVNSAKEIKITCEADITIQTKANLNITTKSDVSVNSSAKITIESSSGMDIKTAGDMNIESTGTLTMKGSLVNIIQV